VRGAKFEEIGDVAVLTSSSRMSLVNGVICLLVAEFSIVICGK
jgi:hypothetical protein